MYTTAEQPKRAPLLTAHEEIVRAEGGVGIRAHQEITDHFHSALRDEKSVSKKQREGNYMHVGSVPVIFINKWKREGFDIFDKNVKFADIIKRLHAEGLDDFISTNKRFG